ncbi:hypothetical protein BGX26_012883 [Mortierella sp. AD094]|nr:hypothetical protein BGX26_012883 [Mortierella sp. AD094]
MHVRHEDIAVEYLTDEKLEFLQPLRISTYLGIVLDVIIELPQHNHISEPPRVYNSSIYTSAASSNPHDNQCHPTTAFINSERLPTSVSADTDSSQTGSVMQQPSNDELGKSSMPSSGPPDHMPQVVLENENGSDDTNIQTNSITEGITGKHMAEIASDAEVQADIDMEATYNKGLAHYDGKDIPQDFLKAKEYFLKAARQGYSVAQNKLAYMYYHGQDAPQDYSKAFEWYLLAAYEGCPISQCDLGDMYYDGKGVHQSYSRATAWYLKASERGYAKAQYKLGCMSFDGADQGCSKSQDSLGCIYRDGIYVVPKAIECFRKSADQGYAAAQYNLGSMYELGQGVTQDHLIAAEWYQKAASQENTEASKKLVYLASK